MDNIKDINLLNGELNKAKDDIEELKKRLSLFGESSDKSDKESNAGYNLNDIAANLNQELKKNEESMK